VKEGIGGGRRPKGRVTFMDNFTVNIKTLQRKA
jgi:hypothetical protein